MDLYNMSLWQLFLAGGVMMWPILACSILALGVIIERVCYLRRLKTDIHSLLSAVLDRVKHHQIKEALQICEKNDHPVAHILKAGILKYDRPRSQIKEAIEDVSLYEIPKLEKNISILATIAHISPLLGFLGTGVGMIRCFQVIQAKATLLHPVPVSDLASGVWEALLTTIAGLIVAIPVFMAYNYLVSRVNGLILEMEKASTELINFLSE